MIADESVLVHAVTKRPWNASHAWFIRDSSGLDHMTRNDMHAALADRARLTGRPVRIGSSAGPGFRNLYAIRLVGGGSDGW